MQVIPQISDATSKVEEPDDAASKRISIAERRARRKEAREAKKALAKSKNTPNKGESLMLYHLRMEERYENPYLLGYDIERMFPGAKDTFGIGFDPERDFVGFGLGNDIEKVPGTEVFYRAVGATPAPIRADSAPTPAAPVPASTAP